jgi:hypothetical protein
MESIDKPLLPQQRNKKVVVVSDTDTDTDEEGYEDEEGDGDDGGNGKVGGVGVGGGAGVKEGGVGDDEDEGWSSEEMTADEVRFFFSFYCFHLF